MRNQDEISIYEQQERRISEKSDAFINLLVKRGILEDAQINDAKIREAQKEKRRQAYHNTQLLLRNYRNIIWQAECEVSRIAEELDTPLKDFDAVLTRVDAEIGMGNRKPEAKLSSLTKFRLLIDRVNEALTLLRKKPDNGERLYQLIYAAYIAPEKQDVDTILERMELSRRHFYRLREQAITVLSIRLWAAPTSDLDMWLDLVALLNTGECE